MSTTGLAPPTAPTWYFARMHNPWDSGSFRELLQRLMDAGSLSQRDVARYAGITQSQVSRWLTGNHRPQFDALQALAAAVRDRHPGLAPLMAALLQAAGYDGGTSQDGDGPLPDVEPPDPVKLLLPPDEYEALTPYMRAQLRKALENQARAMAEMLRPPA